MRYPDGSRSCGIDEMLCEDCSEIIKIEDKITCEICHGKYCAVCVEKDWKQTGWLVCSGCRDKVPTWVDELIDSLNRDLDDKIAIIAEKQEFIDRLLKIEKE